MEKLSGLVLEVGDQECIILAPGNVYVRIRCPESLPAIGEIAQGYPVDSLHYIANRPVSRVWAYVASFLITLIFSGYQVYAFTSAPSAYVSLDMAPSIELVLNRQGNVIETKSNNQQGAELLQKMHVDDLPWDQALKSVVHEAALQSSNTDNNLAILTYTNSSYLKQVELNSLMLDTLKQEQFKGDLIVDAVDSEFRDKAAISKVSPGQQLIIDLAANNSIPLNAEDFKDNNSAAILKEHSLKLKVLVDSNVSNPPINGIELSSVGSL